MALDKIGLKNAIKQILTPNFSSYPGVTLTQEQLQSIDAQATAWANAIDIFVKTGTVTHEPGKVTGGTPANGTLVSGTAIDGKIL